MNTNSDTTNKEGLGVENIEVFTVSKPPSTIKLFWREMRADKLAMGGFIIVVTIFVFAFIGSAIITTERASEINLWQRNFPPSWTADARDTEEFFLLGTDPAGRNMFHQLVIATRNSLTLGWTVAFVAIIFGVVVGIISGFFGGHIDNLIMRIVDIWIMLPATMFMIAMVDILPRTLPMFIMILALFAWTGRARMVRSVTLSIRNMDYISASKTLGTRNITIIFKKVLPNMVSILSADIVLTMSAMIGVEVGLSLLGYGLRPGTPSLGTMMSYATNPSHLALRWWLWAPALIMMFILMLCINYVGQAVSRAADPRQRMV